MTIELKWQCGKCLDIHEDEYMAIECCAPVVYEVYCCPICGEACDEEQEAIECCNSEAAAELTIQDGMKFPAGITDTATYIKEFCEANFLRI